MFKNALALIGLFATCRFAYQQFDKHLRVPLERIITDAIDDETKKRTP
jgi:hypothetical protein